MAKAKKVATKKAVKKTAAAPTAKKAQCAAKTKAGNPCTKSAFGRSKFCYAHKKK